MPIIVMFVLAPTPCAPRPPSHASCRRLLAGGYKEPGRVFSAINERFAEVQGKYLLRGTRVASHPPCLLSAGGARGLESLAALRHALLQGHPASCSRREHCCCQLLLGMLPVVHGEQGKRSGQLRRTPDSAVSSTGGVVCPLRANAEVLCKILASELDQSPNAQTPALESLFNLFFSN